MEDTSQAKASPAPVPWIHFLLLGSIVGALIVFILRVVELEAKLVDLQFQVGRALQTSEGRDAAHVAVEDESNDRTVSEREEENTRPEEAVESKEEEEDVEDEEEAPPHESKS